jgi:hypothetical protein
MPQKDLELILNKIINVRFIPKKEMRYDTTGDYWETDKTIEFRIALMDNPLHSAAILLHELTEYFDVKCRGISIEEIDRFDISHPELDDPGWSREAPYNASHQLGDLVERAFILGIGESWTNYDEKIMQL